MTARCDLESNAKGCAAMYQIAAGRPAHPCNGCETGKKRLGDFTNPPSSETKPASHETITPKEETVDQEKAKENILRVLARKGAMSQSSLKLFAANKATKEVYQAALDELAKGGKVVTKAGIREGSLSVALPWGTVERRHRTVETDSPCQPDVRYPPHQDACQSGVPRACAA